MTLLPYIVAYAAVGVFVIAVLARIVWWLKMPLHVRWELYPVAHEKHADYGGSYLEQVDWWKKPRETSTFGEIKAMGAEILFLVALKEANPKLWLRSFPFHFGLYLFIGCTGLMFVGGVLGAVAPDLLSGTFRALLQTAILACGVGGLVLSLLGALGLLERRLNDPDLKDFTAPADIFNLLFFVVAFGVCLAHLALVDRDLSRSIAFVQALVTFNLPAASAQLAPLTTATVVLLGLLLAYIPLTHMSHFIGKYFAYHAIRWADDPNTPGSAHEGPIGEVLAYPVTWAGPHVKGEGRSWADIATEDMKEQQK